METSILGTPVMIVFGMAGIFKEMISNETIVAVIDYLPSEQLAAVWSGLENGSEVGSHLLVLTVWAVGAVAVTVVVYKKRRMD